MVANQALAHLAPCGLAQRRAGSAAVAVSSTSADGKCRRGLPNGQGGRRDDVPAWGRRAGCLSAFVARVQGALALMA